MRHIFRVSLQIATVLLITGIPKARGGQIRSTWQGMCEAAGDRRLILTTGDGKIVDGFCSATTPDAIRIMHGGTLLTIRRGDVTRIEMRQQRGQHLKSIPGSLGMGFGLGILGLGTPAAPLVIAAAPAALAWETISVPVAAVRDLADLLAGKQVVAIVAER